MSGINILALLYSSFFSNDDGSLELDGETEVLRLGVAFGIVNFFFSAIGFFFVDKDRFKIFGRFRGRRFLLLFSLIGGALALMAAALTFSFGGSNAAMITWILVFTAVYSPGEFTLQIGRRPCYCDVSNKD